MATCCIGSPIVTFALICFDPLVINRRLSPVDIAFREPVSPTFRISAAPAVRGAMSCSVNVSCGSPCLRMPLNFEPGTG